MKNCLFCNQKVEKGQAFIVEGIYPGFFRRWWKEGWNDTLFRGLGTWGNLYHRDCYLNKTDEV